MARRLTVVLAIVATLGLLVATGWMLWPSPPPSGGARQTPTAIATTANELSFRQTAATVIGSVAALGTLLAAVAAAVYARAAAVQGQRASDTAFAAMIAAERAWIIVSVRPDGPLIGHAGREISLPIAIEIKNIGKSPALNVHTSATMHPDYRGADAALKAFSEKSRRVETGHSRLLLPGQSYVRQWVPSMDWPAEQFSIPVVMGTVTYQTLPDHALHQTAFVEMIEATKADGGYVFDYAGETPLARVALTGSGGAFAD